MFSFHTRILLQYCLGSDKEAIVVVIGEVCDKGAPEIWHGKRETSRLDTIDKLQAKQRPKFEIEIREGRDVKSPLCLSSPKPDVRDGMY